MTGNRIREMGSDTQSGGHCSMDKVDVDGTSTLPTKLIGNAFMFYFTLILMISD